MYACGEKNDFQVRTYSAPGDSNSGVSNVELHKICLKLTRDMNTVSRCDMLNSLCLGQDIELPKLFRVNY